MGGTKCMEAPSSMIATPPIPSSSSPPSSPTPSSAPSPCLVTKDELFHESLKGADVNHGVQYNAIYWEFRPHYLPWLARFRGWSRYRDDEVLKDTLRREVITGNRAEDSPFAFYNDRAFIKSFKGDPTLYDITPLRKRANFVFAGMGTCTNATEVAITGGEERLDSNFVPIERGNGRSTVIPQDLFAFNAILKSALKVDLASRMIQSSLAFDAHNAMPL